MRLLMLIALFTVLALPCSWADPVPEKPRSSAEILAAAAPADWRPIDPENLLVMTLAKGQVLIELAPAYAPGHVANVKALVRAHYYDGLAVLRLQDNYVAQWGDADGKRPVKNAARALPAEFFRSIDEGLAYTPLAAVDAYAPETGFSNGFPAARNSGSGETWLAHCYGMVGAGRDTALDSGGGTELYAVIGHAPRHLDRNVTLLGRVVQGIERLSSLPRGSGALGFYETAGERSPIRSVRVAADLALARRPALEALRTDTATWAAYVEARRYRREEWFAEPSGHIEVCNVPLPIRAVARALKKITPAKAG